MVATLIDCPFCDGKAALRKERRNIDYRNEKFTVIQAFYQCNLCNETFTTTESDTFSMNQLYAQYKTKDKALLTDVLAS